MFAVVKFGRRVPILRHIGGTGPRGILAAAFVRRCIAVIGLRNRRLPAQHAHKAPLTKLFAGQGSDLCDH